MESLLEQSAGSEDLVIIGASHERGFFSRLVSPPPSNWSTVSRWTWLPLRGSNEKKQPP